MMNKRHNNKPSVKELEEYISEYSTDKAMSFYKLTFEDVTTILYGKQQRIRVCANPHPDIPKANKKAIDDSYLLMVRTEMSKPEMTELIHELNRYAKVALRKVYYKALQGFTAKDFVANVIVKVLEGTRRYNPDKITLRSFLFGCVRSEISSFSVGLRRHGYRFTNSMYRGKGNVGSYEMR